MLVCHGLVIIAEEIREIKNYNYYTGIKFWVASDIGDGKTQRFLLELLVPQKDFEITKSKIEIGKVCEIVRADIREIITKISSSPDRFSTNVVLSCKLENFKFLAPCIYYENMKDITMKDELNGK